MYLSVKGTDINSQNSEQIKHNMRNGMVRTWVKAYNVLDEGWSELQSVKTQHLLQNYDMKIQENKCFTFLSLCTVLVKLLVWYR